MRTVEVLTWTLVGATTLAFMRARHAVAAVKRKPPYVYISSQRQVDPRRWAHSGVQPTSHINGNRDRYEVAEVKHLKDTLGYHY